MTVEEFKAWFEGFAHERASLPNPRDFEVLRQKIQSIKPSNTPVVLPTTDTDLNLYRTEKIPAFYATHDYPWKITCSNTTIQLLNEHVDL